MTKVTAIDEIEIEIETQNPKHTRFEWFKLCIL